MKRMSNAHMMLTTSDKTIKLWRVETKHLHQLSYPRTESNTPLRIPRMIKQEQLVSAKPRRVSAATRFRTTGSLEATG
jgi:hypothetical protein